MNTSEFQPVVVIEPSRVLARCRVCGSSELEPAIDLGLQPWGNHFLKKEEVGSEPFYPLRVVFCAGCRTPQLDYTVPKEVMFAQHTYLSGITRTLSDHFRNIAREVDTRFFADAKEKAAFDIGSNDGTQLKHFQELGYDVLGVESAEMPAKYAAEAGVPTLHSFFDLRVASDLGRKFQVVNAAGVLFHLEELHSVLDGIRLVLAENGVFVVQFLYMKRIMENLAFDQIYHEHLLYYNLRNLQTLLGLHGMSIFDAYVSPVHGGSVIAFVTHAGRREASQRLGTLLAEEERDRTNELATYREFAEKLGEMKERNLEFLSGEKQAGRRIYGFGAPVKGNTLLNFFGIGTEYLDCLVEKNELRRGLYSPGMHIPLAIESELEQLPDTYYVLAWNFKKEILANNQKLLDRGIKFYFPIEPA